MLYAQKLGVDLAGLAERWEAQFERLRQFRARHGHSQVPSTYREDRSLARWVVKQRVRYREETLEPTRLRRLQALGLFEIPDRWEEHYRELARLVAAHGHARVSPSENPGLASWVRVQRRLARKGELGSVRVRRLKALHFCWEPHESSWQEQRAALRAYRARHGHCDVHSRLGALGSWVAAQRRAHRQGRLSRARVRALESLGFTWNPRGG